MRVVVTGGAGFVGAHLARALVTQGDEVTVLDVDPTSPLLDDLDEVARVAGDVTDHEALDAAIRDAAPERIFHTAGILSAAAEERWEDAFAVNAVGTFELLAAATRHDVERVVFTSTVATFGPGSGPVAGRSTPQRPTSMYGVTKVFGELLGEWFDRTRSIEVRAARLPAVMGAGRGPGGASAYGSTVISEAAIEGRSTIPVAPETVMALVYVKDVVAGLLALADAPQAALRHRTYGLDGFSPTAAELAAAARRRLPEATITFEPDPALSAIVGSWPARLDGSDAAADWGWTPAYDLDAAVADFVADLREHPAWA